MLTPKLAVRHLFCQSAKLVFREMRTRLSYSPSYVPANAVSPSDVPGRRRHFDEWYGFEGPDGGPLARFPRHASIALALAVAAGHRSARNRRVGFRPSVAAERSTG
jgi:hypothetical protein